LVAVYAKTQWHQLQDYKFEDYVAEYQKSYNAQEYAKRKTNFELRLKSILKHNADPTKTWKRGINQFSDWTDREFKSLRGYKKELTHAKLPRPFTPSKIDIALLPDHVDWREKGVVTAVKDQGECGSCWSFGTAETLESFWALKTGQLMVLSEQQILDCTPNPNHCGGTGGCQGGTAELAFQQIMNLGGLSTEWKYPYVSWYGSDFTCKLNTTSIAPFAKVSNYVTLPTNQYAPVMEAVATKGPIVISVEASHWSDYETGVFDGCNQTNPDIDHAVQLVGYGTDPQFGDYWLVRNSWQTTWGENGYIKLRRTASEQTRCGIDITPTDGDGCSGGPPQVTVCGTCGILFDNVYPII